MFKSIMIAVSSVALAGLVLSTEAKAFGLGSSTRSFTVKRNDVPPLQFQVFCLQNPGDCMRSRVSSIAYGARIMRLLTEINDQVNHQITPRTDKGADVWKISSTVGDCDDYAITKRHKLIRAGLPASALRMAVVRTPRGEGHAVLVVKTSAGEFVLDNLRSSIISRQASGYRFLSVSGADPHRWNG